MNETLSIHTTWRQATPEQMVKYLYKELESIPKWRLIKRSDKKRAIRFWKSQIKEAKTL